MPSSGLQLRACTRVSRASSSQQERIARSKTRAITSTFLPWLDAERWNRYEGPPNGASGPWCVGRRWPGDGRRSVPGVRAAGWPWLESGAWRSGGNVCSGRRLPSPTVRVCSRLVAWPRCRSGR
eukprot:scaffold574_cov333-Pavlova_lutheri.AAC.35